MVRIVHIIPLIVLLASVHAQPVSLQRFGIEQGLSQSTVMTIFQDREGFLWFGTWDGLNRYDGYSFVQYRHDPADPTTISHNSIRRVFEDSRGNLWIGTAVGGLNRFDRKNNRFIRYHTTDPSRKILHAGGVYLIEEDAAGRIWVRTSFGLERYDTSGNFVERIDPGSVAAKPFTFEECSGGVMFAWKNRLFGTTAEGTVKAMRIFPNDSIVLKNPDVTNFFRDSRGASWIYTFNDGIYEYRWEDHSLLHRFRSTKEHTSLSNSLIRTMFEDSRGTLWVGTDRGLNIAVRDANGRIIGFEHMLNDADNPATLSSDEVNVIYEDRSGVIWVGTKVGANKILPKRKNFIPVPSMRPLREMIRGSFPTAILEVSDSVVWIGSTGELKVYQVRTDTWTPLEDRPGLTSTTIHTLLKDRKGRIWVGTRYGLNRYDSAARKFIPYLFDTEYPDQIYRNRIYAVAEDDEGIFWIGTSNGVVRFEPESGKHRRIYFDTIAAGQSNTNILSVTADADTLWIGANSHGLLKVNRRTFQFDRFQHDPKDRTTLSNDQPMSILKDRNGVVWIATLGGGLNRMNRHGDSVTFSHFSISEGLLNTSLYSVLDGGDGKLWVSSNYGIAVFDTKSGRFIPYTMKDGLPTHEYNQNSYHRGKSGTLYFGGVNGIARFRPEEITINTTPPPIAVTDFKIFNESRNEFLGAPEIVLPYDQNFFSFEFASLCFEVPEKNEYAYQLEGLESDWNFIGTRRFASFTNIDPGEYTFRVKGSNNDRVWNEQGASFRVVIIPPFWATFWFRTLAASVLVGMIAGSVRYAAYRKYRRRIGALEQQQRILEERQRTRDKIARDLHDDLASTVGSAGLFVETAKRTLGENIEQSREFLEKTSAILNDAEEAMSDIVWSVSPKHDTLQSLATRVRLVTTDLCRANNIRSIVEVKGTDEIPLSDDVRRGFYLIFKEALNNSLKHSRATLVEVRIGLEDHRLFLSVKDNGLGFSLQERTETLGGNGMHNIRKRAEEIGADISIVSAPGAGTTVDVGWQMTQMGH